MTTTITFCDRAENHVGMQIIGDMAQRGFNREELEDAKSVFDRLGCTTELVELGREETACVLVVRQGAAKLLEPYGTMEEMQAELNELEWDTKAPMRGRVVNKRARFNLCFADHAQEPDYENYKGRIIPWEEAVLLGTLRNEIQTALMLNPNSLVAEGNLYYDPSKCGIGFHGDAERRLVVGVRIGEPMKLCYEWYHRFERIGERFEIELDGGDLYVMGDKAVGHDWKKSSILTLRHAAGCAKYTK